MSRPEGSRPKGVVIVSIRRFLSSGGIQPVRTGSYEPVFKIQEFSEPVVISKMTIQTRGVVTICLTNM